MALTPLETAIHGIEAQRRNYGFDAELFCKAVEIYQSELFTLGLPCGGLPPLLDLVRSLPLPNPWVSDAVIAHLRRLGIYMQPGIHADHFAATLPEFAHRLRKSSQSSTADIPRLTRTSEEILFHGGSTFLGFSEPIPSDWQMLFPEPQGSGGSSTVFLVEDKSSEKYYALKLLRPTVSTPMSIESLQSHRPSSLEHRLLNELRFTGGPDERHFVNLCFAGKSDTPNDARGYAILEWMNGKTIYHEPLHHWYLHEPRLQYRIVRQLIDLVAECHRRKIIHRDIKESNFLVHFDLTDVFERGRNSQEIAVVKLADFGIAIRNFEALDANPTFGTKEYMAPELFFGAKDLPTRDVYALGVTLHWFLTGFAPYRTPGGHWREWFGGKTDSHPERPLSLSDWKRVRHPEFPDLYHPIPPLLTPIIERAIALKAADRYPNAIAMLEDFDQRLRASGYNFSEEIRPSELKGQVYEHK